MKKNKEFKRKTEFILSCVLFLISHFSFAQSTEKLKIDTEFWLESAVELYLQDSSYFYASASFKRGDESFGTINNSPFGGRDLLIGYEKFIREKWQAGASFNRDYVIKGRRTDFFTAYLKHNGRIGSLIFLKQLSASYVQEKITPTADGESNLHFGISSYLGKRYAVGKLKTQTGLSYKAVFWKEHLGEPRTVDQTFLRFQQDFRINKNLILSAFASRNTNYFFTEDSNGVVKTNIRTAVYGIRVRLLLNTENANGQLPFVLK